MTRRIVGEFTAVARLVLENCAQEFYSEVLESSAARGVFSVASSTIQMLSSDDLFGANWSLIASEPPNRWQLPRVHQVSNQISRFLEQKRIRFRATENWSRWITARRWSRLFDPEERTTTAAIWSVCVWQCDDVQVQPWSNCSPKRTMSSPPGPPDWARSTAKKTQRANAASATAGDRQENVWERSPLPALGTLQPSPPFSVLRQICQAVKNSCQNNRPAAQFGG